MAVLWSRLHRWMLQEWEGESQASLCSMGDEGSIPRGYKDEDCFSPTPPQQPTAFSPAPLSEMLAQKHWPKYSFLLQ